MNIFVNISIIFKQDERREKNKYTESSRLVRVHIIWLYTAYPKHIVEKKVTGREINKQIHVITGIVVANSRRRTESIYYIKMYIIS